MKIIDVPQGTPEWLNARKGVITGTHLQKIMGKSSKDYIYDLIAQQISYTRPYATSDDMQWGTEHEPEAIDRYESETGILTQEIPFCLHENRYWHGLSPDRLVSVNKIFVGAVEAKCPLPKVHIKYIDDGKLPADYKWQVINYFLVNEHLEWLDFVSFCPDVRIKHRQFFCKRFTRDELTEDIQLAEEKLVAFRAKWEAIESSLIF